MGHSNEMCFHICEPLCCGKYLVFLYGMGLACVMVHIYMSRCMCMCICGEQSLPLGISSQMLPVLVLETVSHQFS